MGQQGQGFKECTGGAGVVAFESDFDVLTLADVNGKPDVLRMEVQAGVRVEIVLNANAREADAAIVGDEAGDVLA